MLNIEVNGNKIAIEGEATVRILPNGAVEVTSWPEVKEVPAPDALGDLRERENQAAARRHFEQYPGVPNWPYHRPADLVGGMRIQVDPTLPRGTWYLKAR